MKRMKNNLGESSLIPEALDNKGQAGLGIV